MIFVPQIATPSEPRRGVVLLVVMALLALFAAVGISFVYYAEGEAAAAQAFRDNASTNTPDLNPEVLLGYFLGQLIYDVDDTNGVYSALRGHSLARNMYGYNYKPGALNVYPYNGLGRIHTTANANYGNPYGQDDYNLVNYQWFNWYYSGTGTTYVSDGFLHDPEWWGGSRTNNAQLPTAPPPGYKGVYVRGNPSYTYPDLNNMFLATVNSAGDVLQPSFFRPWTGIGSLDPSLNPLWQPGATPSAYTKYQTLRPLSVYNPNFPPPEDGGGDVRNLDFGRGTLNSAAPGTYYNNDSIWIDLGFPVMTAPNGQKFKPLFAAFVTDLDGKLNLNVAGNIRGYNNATTLYSHVSNQGWGAWEMNIARVLTLNPAEWLNLFNGNSGVAGRYGLAATQPTMGNSPALALPFIGNPFLGNIGTLYSAADVDAVQNAVLASPPALVPATYTLSNKYLLPGEAGNANAPYFAFPYFDLPNSYGNASLGELTYHPSLFNVFAPKVSGAAYRFFDWPHMEALLRNGGSGSPPPTSDIYRLCPTNFPTQTTLAAGTPLPRLMVATHSFDLGRPGATPWLTNPNAAAYSLTATYPTGTATALPNVSTTTVSGEFGADWAGAGFPGSSAAPLYTDALGARVDLNRFLPAYPDATVAANIDPTTGQFTAGAQATAQTALQARQALALDIFNRLRYVTTGKTPSVAMALTDTDYSAMAWLAQLAVNIVDYRDEDSYSTPFNWNTAVPTAWVYGTELPRLVLNEVYAEVANDPTDPFTGSKATKAFLVNFWVELLNPLPTGTTPEPLQLSGTTSSQAVYKVIISNTAAPVFSDTTLGTPTIANKILEVASFTSDPNYPPPAMTVSPAGAAGLVATGYPEGTSQGKGFYVLGPGNYNAGVAGYPPTGAPINFPGTNAPSATLRVKNQVIGGLPSGLTQSLASTTTPPAQQHNVFLQRLACPYLPYNAISNPYVTVDFLRHIPTNDAVQYTSTAANPTTPVSQRSSYGRRQPYASYAPINAPQAITSATQAPAAPYTVTVTTAAAHGLNKGDSVAIAGVTIAGMLSNGAYNGTFDVINVPSTTTFQYTVSASGLAPGAGGTVINIPQKSQVIDQVPSYYITAASQANPIAIACPYHSFYTGDSVVVWGVAGNTAANGPGTITRTNNTSFTLNATTGNAAYTGGGRVWYPNTVHHSMFRHNSVESETTPAPTPNLATNYGTVAQRLRFPFDWLVHMDRNLISPIEIMQVSQFAPYRLTHQFMQQYTQPGIVAPPTTRYQHRAELAILNQQITVNGVTSAALAATQGSSLYRAFEFLETGSRAAGVSAARVPGKINLNSLWDPAASANILQAICDPQALSSFNSGTVSTIYGNLLAQRTPNGVPGGTDMPFQSSATGFTGTTGINNTIFGNGLFQIAPANGMDNPYLKWELLNKIYNNLTTRSNVFACWLTVGFFEVTDTDPNGNLILPPQLGKEIGRAEGRNIRHRMFAFIDRSQLALFSTKGTIVGGINAATGPVSQTVTLAQSSGIMPNGNAWSVQAGMVLEVDTGLANAESVVVQAVVGNAFTATFTKSHAANMNVIARGNMGPWSNPAIPYRPRYDPAVVPYFNIIE